MLDVGEIPVFVASFAVVAALIYMRRNKKGAVNDDGKRYPPTVSVLPVFGAIIRGGMSEVPAHFMRAAEKLGPVFSCTIGKRLVVVLNSYEAIFDSMARHSEAYADRLPLFTDKEVMNRELRGIIYSHYNEVYRKYHKIVLSILREFGFGVQSVSETRILAEVEAIHDVFRKESGRPFYPKWPLTYATSNVLTSIMFGKAFLQSAPKVHSAIVQGSAQCMENIDMTLNMAPIVRYLPMFRKRIHELQTGVKILLEAIETGIEYIKANNSEPTFVGRFLEMQGTDYHHRDLLYVLRDLCFGSTDTVSTTTLWVMVELANHPKIQKRFQDELDEMVPSDRLPSLDDKKRLPYADAVILEIMRRRTLAPFSIPHGPSRDTTVLDYDIPKGCLVIPNLYSAHMEPSFWKDPETFRPERFLDADNKIIDSQSQRVIAFGLGKRSCIGEILARQSTFLFITSLVQRFDIRPSQGQKTIDVKEICVLTTAPSPFKVRLIPREKST